MGLVKVVFSQLARCQGSFLVGSKWLARAGNSALAGHACKLQSITLPHARLNLAERESHVFGLHRASENGVFQRGVVRTVLIDGEASAWRRANLYPDNGVRSPLFHDDPVGGERVGEFVGPILDLLHVALLSPPPTGCDGEGRWIRAAARHSGQLFLSS